MVGRIAAKLAADRLAHGAVRPVAADQVAGLDRLDLLLVRRFEPLEGRGHRVSPQARSRLDANVEQAPRIVGLEPGRRSAHDVEEEIVHARLIQNDMRKLRQPVLDILDPAAANDGVGLRRIRLPECRLVDPAGLLQHAFAEAIGVEHLHCAAGDAVGLPQQQPALLLLDDAGLDVGECRKLGGEIETSRAATDDQDIDLCRNRARRAGGANSLRGVGDFRIARLEPVQMELHRELPRG